MLKSNKNKVQYTYEDGIRIEEIPYSYENDRDTKSETLYDKKYPYSYDGLYSSSQYYDEEELTKIKDTLDESFELVGRKKQNIHKKYNEYIDLYIYGISKDDNKIVEIKVCKSYDKFIKYVTTVSRLKETFDKVKADLIAFEKEVGQDFSSKLTNETIFM